MSGVLSLRMSHLRSIISSSTRHFSEPEILNLRAAAAQRLRTRWAIRYSGWIVFNGSPFFFGRKLPFSQLRFKVMQ